MANEKRLIDANALMEQVNNLCSDGSENWIGTDNISYIAHADVADIISDAPTVDAVEVVHGRWIPLEYDGYADGNPVWDLWECSECREEHSGDEDTLTPYCSNCGAKMDL